MSTFSCTRDLSSVGVFSAFDWVEWVACSSQTAGRRRRDNDRRRDARLIGELNSMENHNLSENDSTTRLYGRLDDSALSLSLSLSLRNFFRRCIIRLCDCVARTHRPSVWFRISFLWVPDSVSARCQRHFLRAIVWRVTVSFDIITLGSRQFVFGHAFKHRKFLQTKLAYY